ncbi:second domain of [Piromyces finnis]|uniref:Second domain of n=1 Tax=Piromyces finnis TaxID=1754191 RepID=A0A1Y1VBM3_9FUNG|nr:second domain of [Piromyces finnis]|eukprot:ORX52157.1 second domain of [Piromyces finnis]
MSNIPITIHYDKNGQPDFIFVKIRTYAGDAISDQRLKFPYQQQLLAKTVVDGMAEREGQSPQGKQLCSLWMVHNELELQVRSELDLFTLAKKWPKYLEKYTHSIEAIDNPNSEYNNFIYIYKREAIISRNVERKCSDEASIRLFYGEARQNVLTGRYPCTEDDVITLAALQMQTMYGDYDEGKHVIGFLSDSDSLTEFIPSYHYGSKSPEEWERLILDKYQTYSGKSVYMARML